MSVETPCSCQLMFTTLYTTTSYFFTKTRPQKISKLTPRPHEKCHPMARPIPIEDISKLTSEIKPKENKSIIDITINGIKNRSTKNLLTGTITGWLSGVGLMRIGKIAAFGLGGGVLILHFASEGGYINVNWERVREAAAHSQVMVEKVVTFLKKNSCFSVGFIARQNQPPIPIEEEPKPAVIPNPETFKTDDPPFEKPAFLPPKPIPISHPPKISPASIPNPSPSISTTKPAETGFPNYGSYLYSIPGYSAFQPVSFPSIVQPHPGPVKPEPPKPDFVPFPPNIPKESGEDRLVINEDIKPAISKQQDFEDNFTPEIIPATSNTETLSKSQTESKMSITSLAQGSGATVTIPNQVNKEAKKKSERFSLKTSIPISKIDMKCVNNTVDTFQNSTKKPVFNPAFQKESVERPKVEIQSNIVIKTASKLSEGKEKLSPTTQNNSISTLINAAEAISKNESQFRIPEPKAENLSQSPDVKTSHSPNLPLQPAVIPRPMFNPLNLEKPNFPLKPPEGGYNEQKNQILYIQNKNVTNPKMVVTLQNPQNPQVLLQRTNFDSKNLQAPSRLSNQSKKSKEDIVADNGASSKVVALKRLHHDNCDENDFENLITENQIYGNKIVVKEKSQGIQQEQDIKVKNKDKQTQSETKNVVLQPSYVYVSNVQFPANLMMIKTNTKTCQTTDSYKTKVSPNENTTAEVATTANNNNDSVATVKKPQTVTTKDIHLLKSSNVLQTLSNNNNKKTEIVIATNQKVIMSPQVAYQVITDSDSKNEVTKEAPKLLGPKKDLPQLIEMKGTDKKMFIACQYKVDSKLAPKLVIANIKPKIATKVEVVSTLDIYARRKRLRRLKYLSINNNKEVPKIEPKKAQEKVFTGTRNIITPDKMKAEIFKEFAHTKDNLNADSNESDSDYGEEELLEYKSIIEEYGPSDQKEKVEFLAGLRLATHNVYREKDLEKQDRVFKQDSVATAYIAAGINQRADDLPDPQTPAECWLQPAPMEVDDGRTNKDKQMFLSQLSLKQVSLKLKKAYEKTWQEVLKERRRRNGLTHSDNHVKPTFDPNSQLQLLTEIKNCVNINNNLIKKRLDPTEKNSNDIRILAEKNFSELNRLSKMADISVKMYSGQNTRKRDLNPGFDSENIQKLNYKIEPYKDYPKLIIPSISRIVSLKSAQECVVATSSQATSMDEPKSSAAGAGDGVCRALLKTKEVSAQTSAGLSWPGVDAFYRCYREYDTARKKEIAELHRRNTSLCVESAHVTRAASRHSDRARALLAERHHLALEENSLRISLKRLCAAVETIRKS